MVSASQVDTQAASSYYRVPVRGDPVTISGMRRRPELNGARGEIVSGALDEHGRVTVRVFESSIPGQGECRHMKIQPFRLVPMKAMASLPTATQEARPMSRTGSQVSRSLSQ